MRPTSVSSGKSAIVLSLVLLSFSAVAFGQTVSVSPSGGPPTSETRVSGSGFSPDTEIDIYFDTTYEAFVNANSSGSFSNFSIPVPASAVPGKHWVSAEQVSTDTGAQTPFKVNTNWSELGFTPSGNRYNPYENVLSTANVPTLQLKWTYFLGLPSLGFAGFNSSAAVVNGIVYVGSACVCGGSMNALNATTGKLLWTYPTTGPSIGTVVSSPTVTRTLFLGAPYFVEVVYFGSDDHNVYALNASNGDLVWSYTTGSAVDSSPTVVNGVVYVGSDDHNVYALGASNGDLVWSYTTGSAVDSSPAVANGVVYIGSEDSQLYALTGVGNHLDWKAGACGSVESSPVVANGAIYAGDDGSLLGGCVTAFFASDGQILWQVNNGNENEPFLSLAESNGVIYGGADLGSLSAFNYNGSTLWTVYPCQLNCDLSFIDYSSSAVANGVIYVGGAFTGVTNQGGFVAAVDAATGAVLWNYPFDGAVEASPTVANGMLYIQAEDGYLYAFGLPSAPQSPSRPALSSLHRDFSLKSSQGSGQSQ